MATPFSNVLGDSTSELAVPPDWMQGRSAFGGLQAAFAVQAMRAHVSAEVPLRTLQVTFVAPAERVRAQTSVLRTGGSATHVEVRLTGPDDTVATIAIGVFGRARTSVVAVQPEPPPRVATRPAFTLPYIPNVVPAFAQHFAITWKTGAPPFTGSTERSNAIELAMFDGTATTASELHAIALADVIPPLALSFLRTPAPGSTLTWMLELLQDRFDHPLAGWVVDGELVAARDGYTSQTVLLWSPDGRPAAVSRQSMLVFG